MRFSWDPEKNRTNHGKHGLSFDTAMRVFLDPLHLTLIDEIVDGEQRWQTIGKVDGVLLISSPTACLTQIRSGFESFLHAG